MLCHAESHVWQIIQIDISDHIIYLEANEQWKLIFSSSRFHNKNPGPGLKKYLHFLTSTRNLSDFLELVATLRLMITHCQMLFSSNKFFKRSSQHSLFIPYRLTRSYSRRNSRVVAHESKINFLPTQSRGVVPTGKFAIHTKSSPPLHIRNILMVQFKNSSHRVKSEINFA